MRMPPRLDGGEEGGGAFSATRRHTHHSDRRSASGGLRASSAVCCHPTAPDTPAHSQSNSLLPTISIYNHRQPHSQYFHLFYIFNPSKKASLHENRIFFPPSNKTTAHKGGNCARQFASSPSRTYCTSDYLKQISCNFDSGEKDEAIISAKICFLARKRTAAF